MQFRDGFQYKHSRTQLVTDSKRFLTELVCHYRSTVDYSPATLRFVFSSGLPFHITGLHSNTFSTNQEFCYRSWNSIAASEECSKHIALIPGFHLLTNQLSRQLAHSVRLILVPSNRQQIEMVSGVSYAIGLVTHFSIYVIAGAAATEQEVCSIYSLDGESLNYPTLIEVRAKLTGTGGYRVYCQVVSNTARQNKGRPAIIWHFKPQMLFFDDLPLFDIPKILVLSQLLDELSGWFTQHQAFHQRNDFHWQGYQSNDKRQAQHSGDDDLAKAYKTLGLPPNSPQQNVKKKYRELAKQSHPDKRGNRETFQSYANAYEVIEQSWK